MPPVERRMKDVLRCPEKQNNYDETDIHSIFQYALGIEGKTLLTILQEAGLTEEEIAWVHSKESDKGLPGKIVEASYFGYELNSRQEADFETVGAELKTTAADYDNATARYKSGETISVTQIDFRRPVETDFYASHLYDKLRMLIVIFYHRDRTLAGDGFRNRIMETGDVIEDLVHVGPSRVTIFGSDFDIQIVRELKNTQIMQIDKVKALLNILDNGEEFPLKLKLVTKECYESLPSEELLSQLDKLNMPE